MRPVTRGKPGADVDDATLQREERAPASSGVRRSVLAAAGTVVADQKSFHGTVGIGDSVAGPDDLPDLSTTARYLQVRELGRGGMGRVDMVFDRALGRPVAQKRVLEESDHDLLVTEAQVGAQLEHPSIVPVYDVSTDAEGRPQYTMRVVNGRTLRDVLDDNLEPDQPYTSLVQLLGILRQVCLAVDYSHSRGVVHRDLKPENIIVGEFGEVYVLDWGVAHVTPQSDVRRVCDRASQMTVAGTPGYMAPEQALGERVDRRTDVFALGVMLYELLLGRPPFEEYDLFDVMDRVRQPTIPPPSKATTRRGIPDVFDALVRACFKRERKDRPESARAIADAIDDYLDRERARKEREQEAEARASEGEQAWREFEGLDDEARRLCEQADEVLAGLKPWEPAERKQPAWDLSQRAKRSSADAARALARAQTAFSRALGRVPGHVRARRGLAALHYRSFLAAEDAADSDRMAQSLALARSYDDGPLSLELADQGELVVESEPPGVIVTLRRYEPRGMILRLASPRVLGASPVDPVLVDAGSYLVVAEQNGRELRFPLLVERAMSHRLALKFPAAGLVPDGMILIPGGPFLAKTQQSRRDRRCHLPDFAIGEFPVTFREYVEFLDSISHEATRSRRLPCVPTAAPLVATTEDGRWAITDECVERAGRRYVPASRGLDLPVHAVSWYDANAYARWLSNQTSLQYRLPRDLEWDKAMRGADGRAFPMGNHLDPSFAKIRQSRPEVTQPEPIGAFLLDESPCGVRDLAGGVGDWTGTAVDGEPLPGLEDEGTPEADGRQAFYRGHHWGAQRGYAEARWVLALSMRTTGVGFRLALSLDEHGSSDLQVEPMKR